MDSTGKFWVCVWIIVACGVISLGLVCKNFSVSVLKACKSEKCELIYACPDQACRTQVLLK